MNKLGIDYKDNNYYINIKQLTKHALITGATGSGKTTTVKKMVEILYNNSISTIAIDIKGDLSSLAENNEVEFLDFYGVEGKKLSLSIKDIGVYAFANLLDLSKVQTGVLATAFLLARDRNYSLNNIDDLYMILHYMANNNNELSLTYGHLSRASVSTIIRKINILKIEENEGIFNWSNFETKELERNKHIRLLDGTNISRYGKTYSTLVLTLLRTLNNDLAEVGNIDKPKIAFFIDEAHLLFNGTTKEVKNEIIEIIKLIRSKGVSVIFISQLPGDIPNEILSQLGLKIQHGLRLYTANDYKTARNIARSFSGSNKINSTIENISALGIGQVMIQQLDNQGIPQTNKKVVITPPSVSFGVLDSNIKQSILEAYKEEEKEKIYYTPPNKKKEIENLKGYILLVLIALYFIVILTL